MALECLLVQAVGEAAQAVETVKALLAVWVVLLPRWCWWLGGSYSYDPGPQLLAICWSVARITTSYGKYNIAIVTIIVQ